ncbi:MAG: PQQ-binding-like beta-propeller repeat protein, partial [Planctomycetales bacterium]|nr:PQQ-binding-like beta-propeller repeat protein [Planctomycetales bacterium]
MPTPSFDNLAPRSLRTAAMLLLMIMLVEARAEEAYLNRWRFEPSDIRDGRVIPRAGELAAAIAGPVRFSDTPPRRLLLDAKASEVTLATDLAQVQLPAQVFTAEAWVQLETTLEWGGIVGAIQDNGNFEKGWLLGTRADRFCFALSTQDADDGDGRITYLQSESVYEPGHWYHVVGTYDGSVQRLYIDGRLRGEAREQSGAINYPSQAVYCMGAYRDDNEYFRHAGALGEICIYERALSVAEVAARFETSIQEYPGIEPETPQAIGWPTFQRDNARTGITPEQLALPLALEWVHAARLPPDPAWPPPAKQDFWNGHFNLQPRVIYDRAFHVVSVDGRVFFGSSSEDLVTCLDAQTGQPLWKFDTNGPVRLAPHIEAGRVYFGADDGCVYCLDADTGDLRWRFEAAPAKRLLPGNGRLISAWPVRSGVLVHDGQVHFAAGLFPVQGVIQYALDASTGEVVSRTRRDISPQGYQQRRGNQLVVAAGRAPQAYFAQLRQQRKGSGAYLWQLSKDYPYAIIGAGELRFVGGDGKVAALAADDGRKLWEARVAGRAYSLAVANGALLVSTDAGKVYSFRPSGGALIGPAPVERSDASPPADDASPASQEAAALARQIIEQSPTQRGYCLVIGSGRGELVHELARQTEWRLVGLESDPQLVAHSRAVLRQAGLYGRAAIVQGSLAELPFADRLMNLVVTVPSSAEGDARCPHSEIERVLRPEGGVALLGVNDEVAAFTSTPSLLEESAAERGWKRVENDGHAWLTFVRGPVDGAGEWTHLYGDPANTACSGDAQVGGALALQWFGQPGPRQMIDRHHRTAAPLYKQGRLYIPGHEHLFAVDAYNGAPLWDCALPEFRRIGVARDHGNLAADEGTVYAVAGQQCHRFDAVTGAERSPFAAPAGTDGSERHWGYIASVGPLVYGSATMPGASRGGQGKAAIQEGTYFDFRQIVTSESLFCLDRDTGAAVWKYEDNPGAIINPTITIGGERIYFVESANTATRAAKKGRATLADLLGAGANLVALDARNGRVRWKRPVDWSAIQHHLYLAYAQEVLIAVGSRNVDTGKKDDRGRKIEQVWYDTQALDAKTGQILWSREQNNHDRSGGDHGEQDHHPVIVDRAVHVEPLAYDLLTG